MLNPDLDGAHVVVGGAAGPGEGVLRPRVKHRALLRDPVRGPGPEIGVVGIPSDPCQSPNVILILRSGQVSSLVLTVSIGL